MQQRAVYGVWALVCVSVSGCPALPQLGDVTDGGTESASDNDMVDGGTVDGDLGARDGAVPVRSGVDPDRPVTSVTPDEAERVCRAIQGEPTWAQTCTLRAVERSDGERECRARRDACLAGRDPNAPARAADDCDGAEIVEQLAACEGVTIGDIEACLGGFFAQERALTCAGRVDLPPPPECLVRLQARCPGLFRDVQEEGHDPYDDDGGTAYEGDDGFGYHCMPEEASETPDAAADPVDCERFCGALVETDCPDAPTARECAYICTEAQSHCPGALSGLTRCMAEHQVTWTCDQGELDLPWECGPALQCFGGCVDRISGR